MEALGMFLFAVLVLGIVYTHKNIKDVDEVIDTSRGDADEPK
jgi:hypothetical protein